MLKPTTLERVSGTRSSVKTALVEGPTLSDDHEFQSELELERVQLI